MRGQRRAAGPRNGLTCRLPMLMTAVLMLAVCGATHVSGAGLMLGAARPDQPVIQEQAVQLHVIPWGAYRIELVAPSRFRDVADSGRSISAEQLQWRVHGADEPWIPVGGGSPRVLWMEEGPMPGVSRTLTLDYRFEPSWNDPPSVGGYALDVTYRVSGAADLYTSWVWPNPVTAGTAATFGCVRAYPGQESMTLHIFDAEGRPVFTVDWVESDEASWAAYRWNGQSDNHVPLSEGAYQYRISGERSGLCGVGRFTVLGSALPTLVMAVSEAQQAGPPLRVEVTVDSQVSVGEWARIIVEVRNVGDRAMDDLTLELSLPQGLRLLGSSGLSGTTAQHSRLEPGEAWRIIEYGHVLPGARPGVVIVKVDADLTIGGEHHSVEAVGRADFVPVPDAWLSPAASVYDPTPGIYAHSLVIDGLRRVRLTDVPTSIGRETGWHVVWLTDATGSNSKPWLVHLVTPVPTPIESPPSDNTTYTRGGIVGTGELFLSGNGLRMGLGGFSDLSLGHWRIQSAIRGPELEASIDDTPWIQVTGPRGWHARVDGLSGSAPNRITLGWHGRSNDGKRSVRIGYSAATNRRPELEVAWHGAAEQGGVNVRHRVGAASAQTIESALWYNGSHGLPNLRLESTTGGSEERLRLHLSHSVQTAWGRGHALGRWVFSPTTGDVRRDALLSLYTPLEDGLRLGSRLLWDEHGLTLGLVALNSDQDGTSSLAFEHTTEKGGTHLAMARANARQRAQARVSLRRSFDNLSARLDASKHLGETSWVGVAAEVEVGSNTARWEIEGAAYAATYALRLASERDAWSDRVQTTHRIDVAYGVGRSEVPYRLGALAGLRRVEPTTQSMEAVHATKTAFVGAWGELRLASELWGGGAVVRWNSEGEDEYDVYLRAELTPALWIQGGYRRATGAVDLLAPEDDGPYIRLMWAMHHDM